MADAELLRQIEVMFLRNCETPFSTEYDPLIQNLSFTRVNLNSADHDNLKLAWSQFLENAFGDATAWEWPCNLGIAQWYVCNEMSEHAIAVYEHLYTRIRRAEMLEHEENYEEWLSQLFHLCAVRGLTQRARHVAELIGDYYNDGIVSPVAYAEVLSVQDGLRYRELGELVDRDRRSAEGRLRSEATTLLPSLHAATRNHIIDAEVWSHAHLSTIEPTIAPRRLALAVEAEFHYKVFEPNRIILEPALRSPGHKPPTPGQCCTLGQILKVVSLSNSVPLVKGLFGRFTGGPGLKNVPKVNEVLDLIRIHRNQVSHSASGLYTRDECSIFLEAVRKSGWIFKMLSALQPR